MPKIISLTSLDGTLYALYDSGFIFASSGERSWYRVTLPRPYQIEEAIALLPEHAPPAPTIDPKPSISPDWNAWLSQMTRKRDWFTFCPICKTNIQATDTETLRRHWLQGHFNFTPERGE